MYKTFTNLTSQTSLEIYAIAWDVVELKFKVHHDI